MKKSLNRNYMLFPYFVLIYIYVRKLQEGEVQFKVRINERGTRFTEKMKINEKENNVRFMVPKHNNVDRSEVLNEFNLVNNIHIRMFP